MRSAPTRIGSWKTSPPERQSTTLVTALNGTLDVLEHALADLRAIGFPAEETGELDAVFAEIADALVEARSAISRADATDAVDVAEDAYPAARFTDQLYDLGFPASCANLF